MNIVRGWRNVYTTDYVDLTLELAEGESLNYLNTLCAMVALNSRMQHERNHDDAWLAARGLRRLDVDPDRIQFRWAMDFCAQGLRDIEIGRGGVLSSIPIIKSIWTIWKMQTI